MAGKIKEKGLFRVAVYFAEAELPSVVEEAEKLKFRRVGIPFKNKKPHGFDGEWIANLDGISRYLKFCHKYYIKHEHERMQQEAELLRIKQETEEKLNKIRRG